MVDTVIWFLLVFVDRARSPLDTLFYNETMARMTETALLFLCFAVLYWISKTFRFASLVLVGLSANLLVVLANGGLMPVEESMYAEVKGVEVESVEIGWVDHSPHQVVPDGKARLEFLSDWIPIEVNGETRAAASPGDILALVGFIAVLCEIATIFALAIARSFYYRRYAY